MKCSCCGRRKKIMESFEDLGKGGSVCVECSDILYRICDAVAKKEKSIYDEKVDQIKSYAKENRAAAEFKTWFAEDFLRRNRFPSESRSSEG